MLALLDPAHRELDLDPPRKTREFRQVHKNKESLSKQDDVNIEMTRKMSL